MEPSVKRSWRVRAWCAAGALALAAGSVVGVAVGPARAATGGPGGEYFPVSPVRVLDTRIGQGAPAAKVRGGEAINVQVAGVAGTGVPATGVLAVALNVTATNPTTAGYVTVYPAGASLPLASTLNITAGRSSANLAVVGVGTGGQVSVYVSFGAADMVIDVVGWYASADAAVSAGAGSRLIPVAPQRILDTRDGTGAPAAPVGQTGTITLQVGGRFQDRSGNTVNNLSAVVINLTGTEPTWETFITAYPADVSRPTASSLNLLRGETRPNLVMVKVDGSGRIDLYNHLGSTHLVADVVGYYRAGADPNTYAGRVLPMAAPFRAFDTRDDGQRIGANQVDTWDFTDFIGSLTRNGTSVGNVGGLVMNITATDVTAGSYLTAYPSDVAQPLASNLNMEAGQVIPNLAVVPLSKSGVANRMSTYYLRGFTHYLADVSAIILAD